MKAGDGTHGVRGESEESLRCCLESCPLVSCAERSGGDSRRLVNDCFDATD